MAWYNANWQYRAKITANKTKVGSGGVSNWPKFFNLANLSSGHGFCGHVKAAGADIRITTSAGTGTAWLYVELIFQLP